MTAGKAAARRRGAAEAPLRLMFMDEARFGRISDVRRCWAPAGVRPLAFAQVEREYSYAYAALCPFDGQLVSLVLPWANTEMMSLFLAEASRRYANEQLVLIMDQPGWHKAKRLKVPDNITLHWLPPYSPELNPVEHLWDDLREKWFSNKVFNSLEAVEIQLMQALQHYQRSPEEVKSMTLFSWIKLE